VNRRYFSFAEQLLSCTQVLLFNGGKDRTLEYTNHEAYLNIKFQLTIIACT